LAAQLATDEIVVVAGEASGDLHGATLARALGTLAPELSLAGLGGARMAAAGVQLVERIDRLAVVGGTEAVRRLPALWRTLRALRGRLRQRPPSALVLIDFPEFNFRLARAARHLGVPVVYFVPPQLWAWRQGRVRAMARDVSRVLAVFPFEVALYHEAGVPVEFVGHPILDVLPPIDRAAAREDLAGPAVRLVGVLPGSRLEEIDRHLPLLLAAAGRIAARLPGTCFVLALAPTVPAPTVAAAVHAATRDGLRIQVVSDQTYRVMAAADLLLVASGTATLEAACYGTPMVVLYRLSRVSYAIARRLVRGVAHISLPNILVGRGVVPELIQDAATPEALARAALVLLADDAARAAQRAGLLEARAQLGEPGAGLRAAQAVLREARGAGAS
jgi:lipid-A-disaccharide synthase